MMSDTTVTTPYRHNSRNTSKDTLRQSDRNDVPRDTHHADEVGPQRGEYELLVTSHNSFKIADSRQFSHGGRHLRAIAVYLCASTPLGNALTTMTSLVKKLKKSERNMQNELNLTSNAYYTDVNGSLHDVNKRKA